MIILLGKPKTFGDVTAGQDKVYLVDPNTGNIVETGIREIKILKTNGRVSVVQLKIYKLTAFSSVTEEAMDAANTKYNTKVDWTLRMFAHTSMGTVELPGVGAPTIISSDQNTLQRWMDQTGPKRKKIIY